ncbi:cytochrome P450 [Mycena filopes]|nr:cytochrome P450 [Mycena filopes]
MPSNGAALVFHDWAKQYGDVMQLEVVGQRSIILDTHQAAVDLLEKRSSIYSDRPTFPLYDILGWTDVLSFLPYGKNFTKHREVFQSYLSRRKCTDFTPIQTDEARQLARNLITSPPEKYSKFSTSIITRIAAGHQIMSEDDPYLHLSKMVYEAFARTGPPGASAIDLFPFLRYFPRWFPGSYYGGVARAWRPTVRQLYDYPMASVERQRALGEASPSFLLSQLEHIDNATSTMDREEVKGVVATLFAAGESTTWSVLTVFVLMMVLHPEVQITAQAELDSTVGTARLPNFDDRESLTYVEAVLQEALRWHPPTPLGVPHRCTQDDVYRGMYIAKGTLVFANLQGISLDENVYKDATEFRPERFLPPPLGNAEPRFTDGFGFGRRICPGMHLADNSLWIAIATILATCSISTALDSNGDKIVPEVMMSDGLSSHPSDFPCVIRARSPAAEALLVEDSELGKTAA